MFSQAEVLGFSQAKGVQGMLGTELEVSFTADHKRLVAA